MWLKFSPKATIAGYKAVLEAAKECGGKLTSKNILVIGTSTILLHVTCISSLE